MIMQEQIEGQWCWAAVSVSVDHYLDSSSTLTQCQLAQRVVNNKNQLSQNACCDDPDACDTPAKLQDALGDKPVGVGRLNQIVNGFLSFSDIQAQVRNPSALPVCVRIQWSGGSAHFVAIDGVSRSSVDPVLHIVDPLFGESVWDYSAFVSAYRGIGQWTHTFLVKQ